MAHTQANQWSEPHIADDVYERLADQLNALPKSVVHRAREVLVELEGDSQRVLTKTAGKGRHRPEKVTAQQLLLLGQRSPLINELEKLDIDSLTPLEAITRLYELQKKAREG